LRCFILGSRRHCDAFEIFYPNLHSSLSEVVRRKAQAGEELVFDKNEKDCMLFVAATANLRAHIFGIEPKTVFDIASMAGNIIPAVATTNAIIAGMIVLNAIKIMSGNLKDCKTVSPLRQSVTRTLLPD
jgi:ubiquitin-like 1-activating enzyme E1 B